MLTLVISACLSASPAQCDLFDVGKSDTQGFNACKIALQPVVDLWQIAHPTYTVRSAYCMPGRS